MWYRWDPAYPMGRRDWQTADSDLRASDDERNGVADKLSRHFAEGRLDQAEFKTRLDTCMSATTRGQLNGLFHDLPPLATEPPPPPPRHRRVLPFLALVAAFFVVAGLAAGAMAPWWPVYHFPFILFALVAVLLWRRSSHRHHRDARAVGEARSSVRDH